ncbi:polyhydroxyalkanoic acid system family protein [Polyangium sp. 15x6]|uniref:polyhydroxyalkanoic acid system family protein n=1 Tax=Polyangium sp. 15x6 TaxID=3042687 RepID=UPI00249C7B57|nr:polyhydroxyalkanoic acid system family protein [Polyangium sp. 15x6]MDI3289197.1 polyhydroxyalkanoic acid system family protein [Polyangium sp. 15x6]
MAQIDILRPHGMSEDAARRRAEDLARRLEQRRGVRWRWEGDELRLDAPSGPAKGTRGSVRVTAEAVRIRVELPLLLRAMRPVVESKLHEKLDAMLGKA